MISRFILYFTVLFTLTLSLRLQAQSRIDISGMVSEKESRESLIGVNILVYTDSLKTNEPVRFATTNKYGFYSIPGIRSGLYYIFVSSLGYETAMRELDLRSISQNSMRIDFELKKTSVQLDEVVVEDKRADFTETTGTIEVEPELVKNLPSFGGETDLFRALQLLPGVSAVNELSTGVYVRGGSPDQNLTLVDGVLVYNPSHLGGFASTFNSEAIQNIKLIKGNFPAEYGGRLSSVLDVTMREGKGHDFVGSLNLNNISGRMTIEGPLEENATYIISGRTMFLDKVMGLVPAADGFPRYNFTDFNGKVNYVIDEENRIFISGFFSKDRLYEPKSNKDVGFNIDWRNSTVNLTWTKIHSPILFSKTALMYTNYDFSTLMFYKDKSLNLNDFYTASGISDFQFKFEFEINIGESHFVQAGGEAIHHDINTTTSAEYIKEFDYKTGYGTSLKTLEGSAYIQDEWHISKDFITNTGFRISYFQNADFTSLEPRFSFTYYLLDRFVIKGAASLTNQMLHMLQRRDIYLPTDVWYAASRELKPSQAMQGSLGFEATSMDKSFLFTVEGYFKSMENLIDYSENAEFVYGVEIADQVVKGSGESFGVEMFLNKRIGNFTGWFGYTLSWTRRFFDKLNRGLPFFPRHDRRHDISVVLTYKPIENLTFGATWNYSTGQAYSLPVHQFVFNAINLPHAENRQFYIEYSNYDEFRLPPFHKLDLSANYKLDIGTRAEISLNIYNVYNRYNVFSKYIGFKEDENTGERIAVLKQFTLFPILPSLGIKINF